MSIAALQGIASSTMMVVRQEKYWRIYKRFCTSLVHKELAAVNLVWAETDRPATRTLVRVPKTPRFAPLVWPGLQRCPSLS